jgi:hypothetical protein
MTALHTTLQCHIVSRYGPSALHKILGLLNINMLLTRHLMTHGHATSVNLLTIVMQGVRDIDSGQRIPQADSWSRRHFRQRLVCADLSHQQQHGIQATNKPNDGRKPHAVQICKPGNAALIGGDETSMT